MTCRLPLPVRPPCQRGFTLVEMVLVMVITAIVSTMLYAFVRTPVLAYSDTAARVAASDEADTVMRRLTRDVRLALPNSVRVSADGLYLEYLETTAGLRYQSDDDVNAALTPALALSWTASTLEFGVIGGVPTDRHRPRVGDYLVVYNLGDGQEPANAYNCAPGPCNRTTISAMTASTLTMASNPFPAQTAAGASLKSPGKRVHVVTGPVTYHCNLATRQLRRYSGYAISPAQQVTPATMPPAGARNALLASNVDACQFSYGSSESARRRSALLGVRLTLGFQGDAKGRVQLVHQIHVNNTP